MKKSIVVLSVFLLVAAFIPRPAAAAVDFGLKAGFSLSNLTWSMEETSTPYNNITKPIFGAYVAFNLGMIAIQPEIYYWQAGSTYEDTEGTDTYKMDLNFNYIHVPVLAKFRFGHGGLKPVVFAGPAISFLTSAKQKAWLNGTIKLDQDVKEYLTSTDFSGVFGAGLEYSMGKIVLLLDARYNLGFNNIDTEDSGVSIKNKAWMFMLGVGF